MIYINKGREPGSLTKYKKQKDAYFDGCNKDDIRDNLLQEQGYLCAYCMRRIDKNHMKIEHWYPESRLTQQKALDYRNMLGCCEGHIEGTKGNDDTCDTHKRYEIISVNPLDKSTLTSIKYKSSSGKIYSDNDVIEKDLHGTLNLNSERHLLMQNRKKQLDQAIMEMAKLQKRGVWNKNTLEKIKIKYEEKDAAGKKKEYAGIVTWYINKKLNAVIK